MMANFNSVEVVRTKNEGELNMYNLDEKKIKNGDLSEVFEVFGVHPEDYGNQQEIQFLIKSQEDVNELVAEVAKPDNRLGIWGALINLRHKRIYKQNITLNEFLKMFKSNPVYAVEKLFQEKVRQRDITLMDRKKKTAEDIYREHKNEPELRFLKFVL